jgi:peptide/nickel transport system permease protein
MSQLETQPTSAEVTATAEVAPDLADEAVRSQWRLFLRRFLRHKPAVVALFVLLALYVLVTFAKQVSPYPISPELNAETLANSYKSPNAQNWFGTDENGRDVLTRVIHAGRVSLNVGIFVALISGVVGVAVGSLAGFFGGILDQFLMRLTDLFLLVPSIAILSMAQQGLQSKELPVVGRLSPTVLIIGILSILYWMQMARVVRGLMLSLKEKEFVEAARASGASSFRIITRHILPNIIGPIAVNVTLVVGLAILTESTVSFLGFGLKPPAVSWGTMLNNGVSFTGTPQAYLLYFPGLALLLTVLCVNFLGDGLRDAFDPQSGKK